MPGRGYHRGKGKAVATDHQRDDQRYHDPDHTRTPLHEASEKSGPIARDQQRRKDPGHEEDERVQQGQDAEASGRLAEQIEREPRRDRASGRVTRVRVHESDVLVHEDEALATTLPALGSRVRRRSANALPAEPRYR